MQRCTQRDELPFRLAAQHVATGRLGKIYPALDEHSGRVILVESVPLRLASAACAEPLALLEQTLLSELVTGVGDCKDGSSGIALRSRRNIVCYETLYCVTAEAGDGADALLLLRATPGEDIHSASDAPARLVSSLLQDFGKLHPLVVQRYVQGIVNGLRALHEAGVVLGGIASSSVLIGSDGTARLAGCFPSSRALRALVDSRLLANDEIPRRVLGRQIEAAARAQDARSVAYVMAEMLTGMRVRGHLLQREHLLVHVAATGSAAEEQVVLQLLEAASLDALQHPYIDGCDATGRAAGGEAVEGTPSGSAGARSAMAPLIEHELVACREQRRRLVLEVRAWVAQFEKRHARKPSASERPKSVALVQQRCRALSERVQELEARLAAARASEGECSDDESGESKRDRDSGSGDEGKGDSDNESDKHRPRPMDESPLDEVMTNVRNESSSSDSGSRSGSHDSHSSTFGILPTIDVSIRDGQDRSDVHRRSPAQNAFLQRLSPPTTAARDALSPVDSIPTAATAAAAPVPREREASPPTTSARSSVASDRAAAHRIIHQRKEVMEVIESIAASSSGCGGRDSAGR